MFNKIYIIDGRNKEIVQKIGLKASGMPYSACFLPCKVARNRLKKQYQVWW